jgi:VWFA-related protein
MTCGVMGVVLTFLTIPTLFPPAERPPAEVVTRTVYVTATDSKGAAVTDLTAADFAVKEGGKPRDVVSAEPAKVKMRTAVMLDERLLGDGPTRKGLFEFLKRLQPTSEFAIITVGLRNQTVVDHTSDLNVIVAAINKFTLNPGPISNFSESVLDVTKKMTQERQERKERQERPVIVTVSLPGGGEVGSASVGDTLNSLRQSGAQLHAVTLTQSTGGSEQLLEDGAKQSGGRRLEVNGTTAIEGALQQIADALSAQYALTYTLPDGVKADKRVSISVTKKGVTLRAPTAIPDK